VRRLFGVLVVVLAVATVVPSAHADGSYAPPVDGPIVDHFRPPASAYGPGNRGVDYTTEPGEAVHAAADGLVVFAGRVGSASHVVVLHDDGLRTSYSFLASVDVQRGDKVHRGDVVGHAGTELHFGVRAGDQYLDPEPLLAGRPPDVHLVPAKDRHAGSWMSELAGLVAGLTGVVHATAAGVAWAGGAAGTVAGAAWDLVTYQAQQIIATVEALGYYAGLPAKEWAKWQRARLFEASQRGCTPADEPPPAPPPGERIAILVGGLGSSSDSASVMNVDTKALGYPDDHVAEFSYAGGESPGRRQLSGVEVTSYSADQANGDLVASAQRFRDLLIQVRLAHPGVPVDVIAHSQGGLVVREALGAPGDAGDPRLPPIAHVVTLASPHHGADLATANQALGLTTAGNVGQMVLDGAVPATSKAVAQLSERSDFIAEVNRRPLPAGARFTSISGSADVVVPALQTALDGATNVVVPLVAGDAHTALPGSAAAQREIALALGDRGPTCHDPSGDLRLAWGIGAAEDLLGAGIAVGGSELEELLSAGLLTPLGAG
jgi:hypothetical protein